MSSSTVSQIGTFAPYVVPGSDGPRVAEFDCKWPPVPLQKKDAEARAR